MRHPTNTLNHFIRLLTLPATFTLRAKVDIQYRSAAKIILYCRSNSWWIFGAECWIFVVIMQSLHLVLDRPTCDAVCCNLNFKAQSYLDTGNRLKISSENKKPAQIHWISHPSFRTFISCYHKMPDSVVQANRFQWK